MTLNISDCCPRTLIILKTTTILVYTETADFRASVQNLQIIEHYFDRNYPLAHYNTYVST